MWLGLTRLCGDHSFGKWREGVRPAWYEECPQGCPNGAPRGGRASYCPKHRGAKRDFALCPVGAPQGDVLVHSDQENSVNMPPVLANTSTEHSQEGTLSEKEKSGILPDPLGTPPKSLYESHAWRALKKTNPRSIAYPFAENRDPIAAPGLPES